MAVKIEPKDSVCDRLGRSTDKGDAVCMAWSGGLKNAHVRGGFARRANAAPTVITSRTRARGGMPMAGSLSEHG
jgi:hypothetical protein